MHHEYAGYVSENVGIIVLFTERGRIKLQEVKKAITNDRIDSEVLMRSIRTGEYKNIVTQYFGKLPNVSCFDLFDKCQELIAQIPQEELQTLFLSEIKKRANNTRLLKSLPPEIRQIGLSLNLSKRQSENLLKKLNQLITT